MNIIRFPPYVDLRGRAPMASTRATYRVKKRANRVRIFFNKIRKQVTA